MSVFCSLHRWMLACISAAGVLAGQSGAPPAGPEPSTAPARRQRLPVRMDPGGPYAHKICSASSENGLKWSRDPGVRMEHASVPCAVAEDGQRMLLYYVDADRGPGRFESVGCAVSDDGMDFRKKPFSIEGLRAAKALDPCVVKDQTGRFRLYYFASSPGRQDEDRHENHLAVSEDGWHFKELGTCFVHPRLVDPDVFFFKGTWFMYVFGRGRTVIATSSDGRKFDYHSDLQSGAPCLGGTKLDSNIAIQTLNDSPDR